MEICALLVFVITRQLASKILFLVRIYVYVFVHIRELKDVMSKDCGGHITAPLLLRPSSYKSSSKQ